VKHRCAVCNSRVGTVQIPQEACRDTLRQTCVFASGGICGSRSAFWWIREAKRRCPILHARVGRVQIPQKACRDTLCRTCVFASGGMCGSHSAFRWIRDAKRECTIFQAQVGPERIHKMCIGTRYAELVFLHQRDMQVTECVPVRPRHETSKHYFDARVGPVRIPQNEHQDTLCRTCVSASYGICGSRSSFQCVQGMKHR
jgi:hypothetical protein